MLTIFIDGKYFFVIEEYETFVVLEDKETGVQVQINCEDEEWFDLQDAIDDGEFEPY